MDQIKQIDRCVSRLLNEYNEEIEMDIIKYQNYYKVVVTICQEKPPYKDFVGLGNDRLSGRRAAKKALKQLYRVAYQKTFSVFPFLHLYGRR